MTFPFRPGPPPGGGFRPAPQPLQGQPLQGQPLQGQPLQGQPQQGQPQQGQPQRGQPQQAPPAQPATYAEPGERRIVETTGHPAVDAALRSLANASQLAPGEQIAAYEAAHQVLQETLSSIEG